MILSSHNSWVPVLPDGVYLYDIDALQASADSGRKEREKQLFACEQIIESQLTKYGFLG